MTVMGVAEGEDAYRVIEEVLRVATSTVFQKDQFPTLSGIYGTKLHPSLHSRKAVDRPLNIHYGCLK